MRQTKTYTIFLASPGDVAAERKIVVDIVRELDHQFTKAYDAHLRVIQWEEDSESDYGKDPQALLNKQIAQMDEVDLAVFIMKDRFGAPTPRAESGTEEEFRRAREEHELSGRPEIKWYFGRQSSPEAQGVIPEQQEQVRRFRKSLSNLALYASYETPGDFEKKIRRDLQSWWLRHLKGGAESVASSAHVPAPKPPSEPKRSSQSVTPPADTPAKASTSTRVPEPQSWMWLSSLLLPVTSFERGGTLITVKFIPPTDYEEAALQGLREQTEYPYAFRTDGGTVELESKIQSYANGQHEWTLQLRVQERGRSSMRDVDFNGVSPVRQAELKARYLLLGEPPQTGNHITDSMITRGDRQEIRPLIPELFAKHPDSPHRFNGARLMAVHQLLDLGIVDRIRKLVLEQEGNTGVRVEFEGERDSIYHGESSEIIRVRGVCPLTQEAPEPKSPYQFG